MVFPP